MLKGDVETHSNYMEDINRNHIISVNHLSKTSSKVKSINMIFHIRSLFVWIQNIWGFKTTENHNGKRAANQQDQIERRRFDLIGEGSSQLKIWILSWEAASVLVWRNARKNNTLTAVHSVLVEIFLLIYIPKTNDLCEFHLETCESIKIY